MLELLVFSCLQILSGSSGTEPRETDGTYGEYVDGAVVTGNTQQAAVRVEVDTEDCGGLRSSPQLCQDVP